MESLESKAKGFRKGMDGGVFGKYEGSIGVLQAYLWTLSALGSKTTTEILF